MKSFVLLVYEMMLCRALVPVLHSIKRESELTSWQLEKRESARAPNPP